MVDDIRLRALRSDERAAYTWPGRDDHVMREVESGRFARAEAEAEASRLTQLYDEGIRERPDENLLFSIEWRGSSVGSAWLNILAGGAQPGAPEPIAFIKGVYLDSARRGFGIEQRVIDRLVDEVRARGCTFVYATVFASDLKLAADLEGSGFSAARLQLETDPRRAQVQPRRRLRMSEVRGQSQAESETSRADRPIPQERVLALAGRPGNATVRLGERWHGRTLAVDWINLKHRRRLDHLLQGLLVWGVQNGCTRLVLSINSEDLLAITSMEFVDWRLVSRWLIRIPESNGHRVELVKTNGPWQITTTWRCSCGAGGGPYRMLGEAEEIGSAHYLAFARPDAASDHNSET